LLKGQAWYVKSRILAVLKVHFFLSSSNTRLLSSFLHPKTMQGELNFVIKLS